MYICICIYVCMYIFICLYILNMIKKVKHKITKIQSCSCLSYKKRPNVRSN